MIIFKLKEIMDKKGYKNKDVVERTGVSRNTITSLQHAATKRIDFETLDKLCKGLKVRPSDLIEYTDEDDFDREN